MDRTRPALRVVFATYCALSASLAPMRAQAPIITPPTSIATVILMGTAGEKATISAADIAILPRKNITVFDAHSKVKESYEGVLLSDLLKRVNAPFGDRLHGKALGVYVVAEGADHYTAVYSLAEIDPAFHPGTVIIADTMDGMPLTAKQGPLQLVNTEDKRPARWVRQLVAVRLMSSQ